MTRILLTPLLLATILPGLTGCGDSRPAGGGNVTMRDMEVVDGTANDSMADLDNATSDGTPLSNAGLPNGGSAPVQGTESAPVGNSADATTPSRKPTAGDAGSNSSAAR
ncbi:hypothetical protein LWE61_02935 [Sphingobium sufflavum]|uniref:hypothetical protein n=1 Tax=Sphingobium sufflavum TaxID=1129547 RepID=UPI001F3A84DF|nr:hypothetical protein [Sphingobium sufflavum]MCE7795508.1 hypothetical protein [Sphingobium sufflavum]